MDLKCVGLRKSVPTGAVEYGSKIDVLEQLLFWLKNVPCDGVILQWYHGRDEIGVRIT